MISNKKCNGCGSYLTNEKNKMGYTPKFDDQATKLCQRCFQLKHYNKLQQPELDLNEIVDNNIQSIDFSNLQIMMVIDVFDLSHSLVTELNKYNDQIIFLVNKMDLLPKSYNPETTKYNIFENIKAFGYNPKQVLFVSAKNKTSIKRVMDLIENATKRKQKTIFVGKSNVGKSTLINELLKLNKINKQLTVSSYTNTTLNINKITINKNIVLDSPGISFKENILNYIPNEFNKKAMISYDSKFINYQLEPNQSIMISGLVGFKYLDGIKTTFNFYISKEIDLLRTKLTNFENNWNNRYQIAKINFKEQETVFKETVFELDENKKHNINIAGLGMIVISPGAKKVSVITHQEVGVSLAKAAII